MEAIRRKNQGRLSALVIFLVAFPASFSLRFPFKTSQARCHGGRSTGALGAAYRGVAAHDTGIHWSRALLDLTYSVSRRLAMAIDLCISLGGRGVPPRYGVASIGCCVVGQSVSMGEHKDSSGPRCETGCLLHHLGGPRAGRLNRGAKKPTKIETYMVSKAGGFVCFCTFMAAAFSLPPPCCLFSHRRPTITGARNGFSFFILFKISPATHVAWLLSVALDQRTRLFIKSLAPPCLVNLYCVVFQSTWVWPVSTRKTGTQCDNDRWLRVFLVLWRRGWASLKPSNR